MVVCLIIILSIVIALMLTASELSIKTKECENLKESLNRANVEILVDKQIVENQKNKIQEVILENIRLEGILDMLAEAEVAAVSPEEVQE